MAARLAFRRWLLRVSAATAVLGSLLVPSPGPATAQSTNDGMDRSGVLDIRDADERRFFGALLCTCGCPRETIATCTCGFAGGFRSDVRAMRARGMTLEQIKTEWVRRYGPASLAVPPDSGFDRFLYLGPLAAIVLMSAFVITVLQRFRRRDKERWGAGAKPVVGEARDDYDERLDDELRHLDDE